MFIRMSARWAIGLCLLMATGCRTARPFPAPTGAINNTDGPTVVRLIGASGTIGLGVPPHSVVHIVAPASLGEVSQAVLFSDACSSQYVKTFDSPTRPFAYGGEFIINPDEIGFLLDLPPVAAEAQATTECQAVPALSPHDVVPGVGTP